MTNVQSAWTWDSGECRTAGQMEAKNSANYGRFGQPICCKVVISSSNGSNGGGVGGTMEKQFIRTVVVLSLFFPFFVHPPRGDLDGISIQPSCVS